MILLKGKGGCAMEGKNVLIVDDDKNICELLNIYLSDAGFKIFVSHDGSSALDVINENDIDLVLLDVMLPVINGWEVCRMIRQKSSVPIIMLTARDMVEDKLQGFELGADDYIVKPFDPREVVMRVKVRLKDNNQGMVTDQNKVLSYGNLKVDINTYEVTVNDKALELKPKEIQLLYFLLDNKNIVFSREQLLDKVWNYDFMGDTRTVDVHIKNLREKLDGLSESVNIKTVWGVGYKLEVK